MSETLRRTLTPEIRILSEAEGLVRYIASDETVDCYAEVVRAKGWKFDRFAKNAPFVDSHCYYEIEKLLGRVVSFEVKGGQLIEEVKWAVDVPEQKLAHLGFALTKGGYLKAVSVGFTSLKRAYAGTPEFAEAVKSMKMDAEKVAQVRCIHLEQDQLELSACIIGANPNALAKAFKAGGVPESLLAACGFEGDAEMSFLHHSAEAYEGADKVMRSLIHTEMARIFRAKSLSRSGGNVPATSPGSAGGGDEAKRQQQKHEQREKFLTDLAALTRRPNA
jgi:hypothetical protein